MYPVNNLLSTLKTLLPRCLNLDLLETSPGKEIAQDIFKKYLFRI